MFDSTQYEKGTFFWAVSKIFEGKVATRINNYSCTVRLGLKPYGKYRFVGVSGKDGSYLRDENGKYITEKVLVDPKYRFYDLNRISLDDILATNWVAEDSVYFTERHYQGDLREDLNDLRGHLGLLEINKR